MAGLLNSILKLLFNKGLLLLNPSSLCSLHHKPINCRQDFELRNILDASLFYRTESGKRWESKAKAVSFMAWSALGRECVHFFFAAIHSLYAEYIMQNAGLDKTQAESRFQGEISLTSGMQMTITLMAGTKASWWKWKWKVKNWLKTLSTSHIP